MSKLEVRILPIEDVVKATGSDTLFQVKVLGWWLITKGVYVGDEIYKSKYCRGDLIIFCPIDSLIPKKLEDLLFPEGSKTALHNGRVKALKIRGAIGMGIPIDIDNRLISLYPKLKDCKEGDDVKDILGITKYEPPIKDLPNHMKMEKTKVENPEFHQYTDIDHLKKYTSIFETGETVVLIEKIHGCLQAQTKISLADGTRKTIKEIVDNRLQCEVLGMDLEGNIVPSKITNWFDNGKTNDWLSVKITRKGLNKGNSFTRVYCTKNHKFYNPINTKYIEANNLKIGDPVICSRMLLELPFWYKQVLVGKMLGDGSLNKNLISFGHKKGHSDYLTFTMNCLGQLSSNHFEEYESGYGSLMIRSRTISSKAISDLFIDWFIDDKKQVPSNVDLTPISLAFWYMDDGSLSHEKDQEDRVSFATCGFNEQSVNNLSNALLKLGIEATVYTTDSPSYPDKKQFRLRINSDFADRLFSLIHTYIPVCMQYKLPEYYRTGKEPNIVNKRIGYKQFLVEQNIISIESVTLPKENLHKYDMETETHNFFANYTLVHNSNARFGLLPVTPHTWWRKLLKKLNLLKGYERAIGSRLVQKHLQPKDKRAGWYDSDIWSRVEKQYRLIDKLEPDVTLYGEIYGPSVQKGYHYGLNNTTEKGMYPLGFVAFDVMKNGLYMDYPDFKQYCLDRNIPMAPELFVGPFSADLLDKYVSGNSVLCPEQKIREGFVIRRIKESNHPNCGRVVLKVVNPEYLLKDQTEWH